jgi:hypothetical protein
MNAKDRWDQESHEALDNILGARLEAEEKAIDSLGRYKFEMFGYWASAWVKYNQLLPKRLKKGNPFADLVKLARQMKEDCKRR